MIHHRLRTLRNLPSEISGFARGPGWVSLLGRREYQCLIVSDLKNSTFLKPNECSLIWLPCFIICGYSLVFPVTAIFRFVCRLDPRWRTEFLTQLLMTQSDHFTF